MKKIINDDKVLYKMVEYIKDVKEYTFDFPSPRFLKAPLDDTQTIQPFYFLNYPFSFTFLN